MGKKKGKKGPEQAAGPSTSAAGGQGDAPPPRPQQPQRQQPRPPAGPQGDATARQQQQYGGRQGQQPGAPQQQQQLRQPAPQGQQQQQPWPQVQQWQAQPTPQEQSFGALRQQQQQRLPQPGPQGQQRWPQGQQPIPQELLAAALQQQAALGAQQQQWPQGQQPIPQSITPQQLFAAFLQQPQGEASMGMQQQQPQQQPPKQQSKKAQKQQPKKQQQQPQQAPSQPPPGMQQQPEKTQQQQPKKQQQQPQQPPSQPPPGITQKQQPIPKKQQQQFQQAPSQPPPGIPQQQQQQQQTPQQSPRKPAGAQQSPPPSGSGNALDGNKQIIPGKNGRKIKIESNHVQLNLGNIKQAVHYDVTITPDTPKSRLRDVMNIFGQQNYPKRFPAFDGRKNLYAPTLLPFGDSITGTVKILSENDREKEYKVEIKFARTVDLSPLHDMMRSSQTMQDAIQVLDIVLRNAPSNTCIPVGRSFFTPPRGQIIDLGQGMEMYYGFFQSAIRGWKPLLNIDVAHKAFPTEKNVIDVICDLGSDFRNVMRPQDLARGMNDYLKRDVEKFLRTLKVRYELPQQPGSKKVYRVNGLEASASRFKFSQDGREMTVQQYYEQTKRIRLQFPDLPTLWVGSRDRKPKIVLPAEFCTVMPGQALNRKMTENQTSAMIKKAATDTGTRKNKIMTALSNANYNRDNCIREFGFSVGDKFEMLDARVLQPPMLQYAGEGVAKPAKGVWRSDRNQFVSPATINKWTVVSVTRSPPRDLQNMMKELQSNARAAGMNLSSQPAPPSHVSGRQSLQDITQHFKSLANYDLIFVIIPNSGPQYSHVKKAAEINVGCLTQCIKERTLFKFNGQTAFNILLKVNSKMNGISHHIATISRPPILARPCMIMGADVTHPSPDAKDIPSVAAVTASHDPKGFQYNICWRLQPPKVEIIEDLCNIVVEQLKYFYQKTNHKPETIVFFRDGVSEGQFPQVQHAEINAIRKACKMVQSDGFEPRITFLVVQKRHHTRLFPTNPRDSEDRNNNVPAGTCVDTQIVNPLLQDFYLVSHASIQGVAKPTKYVTLWDDNDMTNDAIEQLTYHLCHMFTRCNRSVSYPAPTYYAHLAAARAKVYIENDGTLDMSKLKAIQERNYTVRENIIKGKPMFFV